MRVLVVEDEPRLAEGLRAGLVADGFAVDVALTGPNGLWLRHLRDTVDRPFGRAAIETLRGAGYRLATDGG